MISKAALKRAKRMYKNLSDPAGLVGQVAHAKRPNSGRKHAPEIVLEYFLQRQERSEKEFRKAISTSDSAKI